jgi:hypothetical protein
MLTTIHAVLALALALSLGNDRVPDRVVLTTGSQMEGRVVFEDASKVILRMGTGEKRFERKEIKTLRSRARLQRDAFDRWTSMPPDSVAKILDLARVCQKSDLLEDAQVYAWCVLLLDRSNADAHALLEHRKRGSSWDVQVSKSKWVAVDKLFATRPDWSDAYETATAHYLLETNFGQETAVRTALDLEAFYRAFYDLFGTGLELFEVLEPMPVRLHADSKSFPPIATGRGAYTDPSRNCVEIDASTALRLDEIFHEATHQVIEATTRFAFAGGAVVPGWLHEGLAEYMRAGVGGLPGHRTFTAGARIDGHFAIHAAAKSPYSLSRVVHFEPADFLASSRSDLKYAQAYTLVHFCMDGDSGRYRAAFLEYMHGVWKGGSSNFDVKKALKVDEGAFEKAWLAYVRANAR